MKNTLTILVLTLLVGTSGFSQQIFQYGTVVTKDGQRIDCMIPLTQKFGHRLKLKSMDDKVTKVNIKQIHHVETSHSTYETVAFKRLGVRTHKLMQVVVEGELTLYREVEVVNPTPKNLYELKHATMVRYVVKKGGSTAYISQHHFARKIVPFIHRVPGLVGKIANKDYQYDDLRQLVIEYNKKTEQQPSV